MTDNTIKKQKCPKCKKQEGLELIYDTPTEKDIERVRQGLAIPGGFMPKKGPVYKWNCGNCGHVLGKV
jgi:ribosomal protein S27AE